MNDRIDNISAIVKEKFLVCRESTKFFIITKQVSDIIDKVEKLQTQVINLLMDANHGKINPALFKPHQLAKVIYQMLSILPGQGSKKQLTTICHLLKT